jgi:hypothetical protein
MADFFKYFYSIIFLGILFSCTSLTMLSFSQEIDLVELPEVIKNANDGAIIYIKNGTYPNVNLRIQSRGKRILIRPKEFGEVIITGKVNHSVFTILNSDQLTFEGFLFEEVDRNIFGLFNSNNISIKNNYFTRCGNSPTNSLIRLRDGSSNNKIYNNTFDDIYSLGIVIVTSSGNPRDENNTENEIFLNYFINTPPVSSIYPGADNGMECIQIGHDLPNTISYQLNTKVYNNLFENVIGDGVEIISNKSSKNQIFQNTFLNNRSGVTLRSGNEVSFYNNYLENTTRGIRVFGAGHRIYSNYISNARIAINLPSSDFKKGEPMTRVGYYRPEDLEIRDNIIVSPREAAIKIGTGSRSISPDNLRIDNNKFVISDENVEDISLLEISRNSRINFQENVTFSERTSNRNEDAITGTSSRKISDLNSLNLVDFLGFEPFISGDKRVGATWRRPILKE